MNLYNFFIEAHTTDGNQKGVIIMDRTFRDEKNKKNEARDQKNAQDKQQREAQDKSRCCGAEDRKQNRFER